nr:MAG TPA: hypothetical protein [Caudoviricetes sp.]
MIATSSSLQIWITSKYNSSGKLIFIFKSPSFWFCC